MTSVTQLCFSSSMFVGYSKSLASLYKLYNQFFTIHKINCLNYYCNCLNFYCNCNYIYRSISEKLTSWKYWVFISMNMEYLSNYLVPFRFLSPELCSLYRSCIYNSIHIYICIYRILIYNYIYIILHLYIELYLRSWNIYFVIIPKYFTFLVLM